MTTKLAKSLAALGLWSMAFLACAASGVSEVDAAWLKAMKAGDAEAASNCYASDALLWVKGAPLTRGSKEILDAYKGFLAAYTVVDGAIDELGSETIGDKSVAWGTYRLVMIPKAGGKKVSDIGRYTEVAVKNSDRWVYTVDHASGDPAPAGHKTKK